MRHPGKYEERRMKPLLTLLVLVSNLVMPTLGVEAASAYPARPIRLIVPFPPGGGTDLVSRMIQPELPAQLGQQGGIDNRGGAQGLLGTGIAAPSAPAGFPPVQVEIGSGALA